MVVKQEIQKTINKNPQEVYRNIISNFVIEEWNIIKLNKIESKNGIIYEIIGITTPLAGFTLKQAVLEDWASMVPFFIQIRSLGKSKCSLYGLASGSENVFGWDFGRNKKIVNKILIFSKKPLTLTKKSKTPKNKIHCKKCGYDNDRSVLNFGGHCEKCDATLPNKNDDEYQRIIEKFLKDVK